jgi:hypothetical protein
MFGQTVKAGVRGWRVACLAGLMALMLGGLSSGCAFLHGRQRPVPESRDDWRMAGGQAVAARSAPAAATAPATAPAQ